MTTRSRLIQPTTSILDLIFTAKFFDGNPFSKTNISENEIIMKRILSIAVAMLLLLGFVSCEPAQASTPDRLITKADVLAAANKLDPNHLVTWGYGYPAEYAAAQTSLAGFNLPYFPNNGLTDDANYHGYVWTATPGYAGVIYISTNNALSYLPYLMTHEYMHTYEWRYVNDNSKTATGLKNYSTFADLGTAQYHPADYQHPAYEYLADCMLTYKLGLPLTVGSTTQTRYGCPNYALYLLGRTIVITEERAR